MNMIYISNENKFVGFSKNLTYVNLLNWLAQKYICDCLKNKIAREFKILFD